MTDFRFENLEVWQDAIKITSILFDFSDKLAENKKYRFAEQLNGAALSISNNIAEGSGSSSKKEFARYLSIARQSLFECVNILFVLNMRGLIYEAEFNSSKADLVQLSRKLYFLRKKLLTTPTN